MRIVFGLLLLIGLGIGALFGVKAILWQQEAVTRFVATPAEVRWVEIKAHRSRKSTSYSPEVKYSYTYGGRGYESDQVLPFDETGSRSWAEGVVSGLHVLSKVTAYVNPAKPEEAILVRQHMFTPYVLTVLALEGALFGLGLTLRVIGGGRKGMTAVPLDETGKQLLLPVRGNRQRMIDAACWWAGTVLATVPVLAHWLMASGRLAVGPGVFIALAGALVAILTVTLVRRWSIARHVSDARVYVTPAPMRLGEVCRIEVEMDAYSPLRVKEARALVVCTEHYKERRGNKTQVGSRKRGEQKVVLHGAGEVPAGQALEGKGELFFGQAEWPPTSEAPGKVYPYYTWELVVEAELEGMVDYKARFPLVVV